MIMQLCYKGRRFLSCPRFSRLNPTEIQNVTLNAPDARLGPTESIQVKGLWVTTEPFTLDLLGQR